MMPGYWQHSNSNNTKSSSDSSKGIASRSCHCQQEEQMAGKNATCNLNKSQPVTNAANRCCPTRTIARG